LIRTLLAPHLHGSSALTVSPSLGSLAGEGIRGLSGSGISRSAPHFTQVTDALPPRENSITPTLAELRA
jgi:hypothetical protein